MGKWAKTVGVVIAKAHTGFKLSEVNGLQRAVASQLIDRGKLHATRLPNGDYLVTKD